MIDFIQYTFYNIPVLELLTLDVTTTLYDWVTKMANKPTLKPTLGFVMIDVPHGVPHYDLLDMLGEILRGANDHPELSAALKGIVNPTIGFAVNGFLVRLDRNSDVGKAKTAITTALANGVPRELGPVF